MKLKLLIIALFVFIAAVLCLVYGARLPHRKEIKSLSVTAIYAARVEVEYFAKMNRYNPRIETLVNAEALDGAIAAFKDGLPKDAADKCADCETRPTGFTVAAYRKAGSGYLLITVDESGKLEDRSAP